MTCHHTTYVTSSHDVTLSENCTMMSTCRQYIRNVTLSPVLTPTSPCHQCIPRRHPVTNAYPDVTLSPMHTPMSPCHQCIPRCHPVTGAYPDVTLSPVLTPTSPCHQCIPRCHPVTGAYPDVTLSLAHTPTSPCHQCIARCHPVTSVYPVVTLSPVRTVCVTAGVVDPEHPAAGQTDVSRLLDVHDGGLSRPGHREEAHSVTGIEPGLTHATISVYTARGAALRFVNRC